ncbi:MAG: class A beta-lactamase-related serine hydrolase [Wenzhouxiangella sp.]|nr:MAG: class A beta-lactamase-related serine hydrolase [Wenzhouxiangella sp.]
MQKLTKRLFVLSLIIFSGVAQVGNAYFPPAENSGWATSDPEDLGWDTDALDDLVVWLGERDTRAFIILKDGRIAVEEYFGDFERESNWYWASAGKTVTAFLIGVLEKLDSLNIDSRVSDYLGTGWTSFPGEQEDAISIWHQLTMTTGIDYQVDDQQCTLPECLEFREDAGEQWYYHNAPYTLLTHVIEAASEQDLNDFLNDAATAIPGFNAFYAGGALSEFNRVVFSRPLDMARFGLFISQGASWDGAESPLSSTFFDDMVNPSQSLNPSYGYLWWLNGQDSFIPPQFAISLPGPLVASAPDDMYSAIGLNGQILSIVPSEGLVVIRMGGDPGPLFQFHEQKWGQLGEALGIDAKTLFFDRFEE